MNVTDLIAEIVAALLDPSVSLAKVEQMFNSTVVSTLPR